MLETLDKIANQSIIRDIIYIQQHFFCICLGGFPNFRGTTDQIPNA